MHARSTDQVVDALQLAASCFVKPERLAANLRVGIGLQDL